MGVMNEDRLTLYDGLIKTHITNTTVAKETGKGLSTNDYTTTEKNKLAGIDKDLLDKLGESTEGNLTFNGDEINAAQMTGATADKDGASGTVTAPKAGDQTKFLRGDGTWAEASGGGTKISPKATVNPTIKNGNAKCTITWGDPDDVIADGVILSTWKGTKLVMKETGYPENENDGTVIVDNKTKDAYVSTGYEVTGLTNGNTYYFKLFPYSTDGIYNYQDSNKLVGNPSLVKLDSCTNMNVVSSMGKAVVSWTDPEATKTVDGITATWAKTVLVYKQGSIAPVSISDGIIAVEETVQNTYSSSGFEVTGLTDGQEYTFALFAVSTENSYSDVVSTSVQLWATLNITTTETTLYEKEVTVTNSASTVTGTFSSTGSVSLNIPWIGSTVITATDGTETGDETIEITVYMDTYSLQFSFIPDGATITPVDDVKTLVKCAGVSSSSYTTIADVLGNDDTMSAITMDENAMKYLARSTGFADDLCADETFMTFLGQSPYVDDTVLNSDIWVTTINASQYWSLVYTTIYTIHAGASEKITIDGYGGSFTTNADGTVNHVLPLGELTFHGSVSGNSFTRTVTKETTDVKVMPDGALYWYGNECTDITGGFESCIWRKNSTSVDIGFAKNTNDLYTKVYLYDYGTTHAGWVTHDKINTKSFSKIYMLVSTKISGETKFVGVGIVNSKDTINGSTIDKRMIVYNISAQPGSNGTENELIECDISNGYDDNFVMMFIGFNVTNSIANVHAIWLE